MKLANFLKPDRIILGLPEGEQKVIFEKLMQPLVDDKTVTDPTMFLSDLTNREAEITTAMDNGVAIPHARSHVVTRLALVVGVAGKNGIKFNPASDTDYWLFFCIAIPSFAPTSHIPLLRHLATFSGDPKRVDKAKGYKTPTGLINFIGSFKT